MHAGVHRFIARRVQTPASLDMQTLGAGSIGVQLEIEQADILFFRTFQQHTAGAITEQDAGVAILHIEDRTHLVGADYQHLFQGTTLYALRAGDEAINESRASRGEIVSPSFTGAYLVLHQAGGGWKKHVGGYSGNNDQIDFGRIQLFLLQDLPCHLIGHKGSRLAVQETSLSDARAITDPLIGGFHEFGQLVVGDDFLRQVMCSRRNDGAI